MMNVFTVGVTIQLIDKVSAGLGIMARGMMHTQQSANALEKRLQTIQNTFLTGSALIAAGTALAAPLVIATRKAQELEMAIARVRLATQSTTEQMAGFSELLSEVSNKTAIFSKPMLAGFSADMAASGIRNIKDIKNLLPTFAQAADVLKVLSHGKITPTDTAHTLSALAHQFGRFDEKEMRPIVEAAVAMAPNLPGGIKGFANMGGYVNILGHRVFGMDPIDLMTLQAAAMQTVGGGGTGARGALSGAAIMNFLARTVPGVFGSGLLSGKSAFALRVMGFTDAKGKSTVFDQTGHLNKELMFKRLTAFHEMSQTAVGRMLLANRMIANAGMMGKKADETVWFARNVIKSGGNIAPAEISQKMLQYAFGASSRVAAIFSDPKFQQQVSLLRGKVDKSLPIEQQQEQLLRTAWMQQVRAATNFETLMSTIGTQLLPLMKEVTLKIGDIYYETNKFLEQHPKITQFIVGLTAVASGIFIIAGAALVLKAAVLGLAIFAPAAPWIIAVTAAIAGIIWVTQNWDKVIGFLRQHLDQIKVTFVRLVQSIPGGEAVVKTIVWFFKNWNTEIPKATKQLAGLWNTIINFISQINGMGWLKNFKINVSDWFKTKADWAREAKLADAKLKEWGLPTDLGIKNVGTKTTTVNANTTINGGVHVHPPNGDPESVFRAALDAINKSARQAARSHTTAGGTNHSHAIAGAH